MLFELLQALLGKQHACVVGLITHEGEINTKANKEKALEIHLKFENALNLEGIA